MDAGWARWILEQFEFEFTRTFPPMLDAGNLNAAYDALVFVEGGIPAAREGGRGGRGGRGTGAGAPPPYLPAEYAGQLGRVTVERTLPAIRAFLEQGGTVVAIGESAVNLAAYLKLPIGNHLVENGEVVPRAKYFVPGSVLSMRVNTADPVAHGMADPTDAFFDNSPVFRLEPGAEAAGVTRLAWFDSAAPLRSGWAWGQRYLNGGVAAVSARVGKGRAIFFGPEILKRAQPHGTFKLLFNALYSSVTGWTFEGPPAVR
jgi:hypothetical protein